MALSPQILSISALPSLADVDHVRTGVHLRWTYHPVLGFPNGPVEISRAVLDGGLEEGCERLPVHVSEVGHGLGATLPVSVPAGQPVWCRPMVGAAGTLAVQLVVDTIDPEQVVGGLLGSKGFVPVQHGAAAGPHEIWVTAAGINAVRVIGPGQIVSATAMSLDCARRQHFDPLAMVGPPFDGLFGYDSAPIADPEGAAELRVRTGAPPLESLVDAMSPTTLMPGPNDDDREWDRVVHFVDGELTSRYRDMLDSSSSPLAHRKAEDLVGGSGNSVASLDVPSYAVLMAATREPGVARWAGVSLVDPDPFTRDQSIYRIRASFDKDRVFAGSEETPTILAALDVHEVAEHGLEIANPATVLEAYVAVVPWAQPPLTAPGRPDGNHVRWLTAAPRLRRLVDVEFDQPVGAVGYAWYRRTGGPFEPMNAERIPTDYRLLDPAMRRRTGSGRWVLTDPGGPPGPIDHGIAATDAFGRWSTWTNEGTPPGPLVPPPPPVLQAEYLVAPVAPVDDTLRAGSIRVTIPVPDELPPGSADIERAHIRIETTGGALVSSTTLPVGAGPTVSTTLAGPALERAESSQVRAAAQFEAGGVSSSDGTALVTAVDGRPPAGLKIVSDVHWTTRSDAVDSSRLVLRWSTGVGHSGYRVYVATTRTLVDHFSTLGAVGTELLAVTSSATATKGEMAAALAPHLASLPRSAFELMTSRMIDADPAGCSYELVVPGRSRLLYLVRIAAVGPNNVDEDWSGPPALFLVAVPPTVRVQPPELETTAESRPVNAVRVAATLRNGQRAVAWRLFRTTKPDLAVAGKMSELATESVTMPASDPFEGGDGAFRPPLATLEYEDRGPSRYGPTASLKPWRTYIYRAQVQGEAEPGGPPGVWSDLSLPVSAMIVPDERPPAPVVSATRTASGLEVSWACELPARRTDLGDFHFRVMLREQGNSVADDLGAVSALGAFRYFHDQDAAFGPFPALEVLVEAIDPIGRRTLSDPATVEAGP